MFTLSLIGKIFYLPALALGPGGPGGASPSNRSASESDSTTLLVFFLTGLSFSDWDSDFLGLLDPSVAFLGTGSFFTGPGLDFAPPPPAIMVEKRSEDFANFFGGGFFPWLVTFLASPPSSESETSNSSWSFVPLSESDSMSRTSGDPSSDSILADFPRCLFVFETVSGSDSEVSSWLRPRLSLTKSESELSS